MNNFSKESPDFLLAEAALFGVGAMVERQESLGQQGLVNSTVLPARHTKSWEVLQRWGFQQLESVDDLFCNVVMPQGWQKVATDHSIWSNLLDDRGLIRGKIFYKASFHERDAFIDVCQTRFCVSNDYTNNDLIAFKVIDTGTEKDVKRFVGGQYAVLNETVGFLFKGLLYCLTEGRVDAHFIGEPMDGSKAEPLTLDQFYKQYHHVNLRHDLIEAAENLTRASAEAFIAGIPSDYSQWLPDFDFPETDLVE